MNDKHIQSIYSFVSETKNAVSSLEENINIVKHLCLTLLNGNFDMDLRTKLDGEVKRTLYKCSSLTQSILDDFNYINKH